MEQNEEKLMLKTRDQISEKYKWAIEDLYINDDAWKQEYELLQNNIGKLKEYEGRLGESASILLASLKQSDSIDEMAERVYVYANQRLHENTADETYQQLSSKAQMLMTELSENTAFLIPEILAIDEKILFSYLEENDELKVYKKFITNILREKAHVLSKDKEAFLAKVDELAQGPSQIFSMFNNADIKFSEIENEKGEKIELTHGRYVTFLENQNRRVRKDAFKAMYQQYSAYKNTLAAAFGANVKQAVFYAQVRNYDSSLHKALSGSNIPVSVYTNLIDAVERGLPVLHRYMKLRKQVLNVDELHMYDLYVPMVAEAEMKIPFDEAKELVLEGLKPLGEEYIKVLREGFSNRWIDIYENQGKRSGAYSWGAYGTHPYVLLNYQNNLNNTFTLAHEMGHALHSYYSDEKQPYVYAGYKIFVAEVASTCNEALLIHYLLERAQDEKTKAYLINYFLEQFRGTMFRQTMFAEFEKKVHEQEENKEALTADMLCNTYYDLNKKYYGAEMAIDEEISIEWARIPHFYTPFYVYQYATGFAAAIAISSKILENDETVRAGYLQFLSSGSSLDPIDLLKLCGVDMTQKEPVEAALGVFEEYLGKLEELLLK